MAKKKKPVRKKAARSLAAKKKNPARKKRAAAPAKFKAVKQSTGWISAKAVRFVKKGRNITVLVRK
jgi:hypothetical protein